MRAPEFPQELEWSNVPAPLRLADLRGKLVLLDFWTYCCINCLHILPDLHYLEEKYPDTLTVIGLHSPKFPNERVAKHVEQAINRYNIKHPIASDPELTVWQQYGIHAWPTLVLINTTGEIVGVFSGEGHREELDELIQKQITIAKNNNTLKPKSLTLIKSIDEQQTQLLFPGKILVTEQAIYISDTGHHRILETDHTGKILRSFGNGKADLIDGNAQQAAFNHPQGIAYNNIKQALFIADTNNHAIRKIDLINNAISTLAGTGQQGSQHIAYEASPLEIALNSPWDLIIHQNILFIAMAGNHQIWAMDLINNQIISWAGNRQEALFDGELKQAAFAQPSGITASEDALYIADSESSAIRKINLHTGHVTTLVGMGLFEFGDRDGIGHAARLQHPLGVTFDPVFNVLWVADSYNHVIRRIDLQSLAVMTLKISLSLAEPGGISIFGDKLWVADTNNHRIVKIDPYTGEAEELNIK